MIFKDRQEAGSLLVAEIKKRNYQSPIVLAIPRGGVVIGDVIARELNCSLDMVVVKKIGCPGNSELAIGAVGPEDTMIFNEEISKNLGIDEETVSLELRTKNQERNEKERILRGNRPYPDLKSKTVILVDDGIATGATIEVAIKWIKSRNPQKIVLAAPVVPADNLDKLKSLVDEIIFLSIETNFWAVGQFYQNFPQVEDEEVGKILRN